MEKEILLQPWRTTLKINGIAFTDNDLELEATIQKEKEQGDPDDTPKIELKLFLTEKDTVEATLEGIGIIIRDAMDAHFVFSHFLFERNQHFPVL